MLKEVIIFVFAVVASHADEPAAPQNTCGNRPVNIFNCLIMPPLFTPEMIETCKPIVTPCAKVTCLFTETGTLKDGKVDKPTGLKYFDSFAEKHAAWAPAANSVKTGCLENTLPAQGIFPNCTAFDILYCSLSSFAKNIPESAWLKSAECDQTREYTAHCPVCPSECFSGKVPTDACNACNPIGTKYLAV